MTPKKKRHPAAHRFTWFDGVILLFFLAALLLGGWYGFRARSTLRADTAFTYTLSVRSILRERIEGIEVIRVGGRVTSSNGTAWLGEVEEVWTMPHRRIGIEADRALLVEDPFRVDIHVRVRATGRMAEGDGLRVSDVRIAVGMHGDFRIDGYLGGAEIVSVTVEEAKA